MDALDIDRTARAIAEHLAPYARSEQERQLVEIYRRQMLARRLFVDASRRAADRKRKGNEVDLDAELERASARAEVAITAAVICNTASWNASD